MGSNGSLSTDRTVLDMLAFERLPKFEFELKQLQFEFKVVVIGDVSSNSTSLGRRYIEKEENSMHSSARADVEILKKTTLLGNTEVRINLWDVNTHDTRMLSMVYNNASGVIIVFDKSTLWRMDEIIDQVLVNTKDEIFSSKNIMIVYVKTVSHDDNDDEEEVSEELLFSVKENNFEFQIVDLSSFNTKDQKIEINRVFDDFIQKLFEEEEMVERIFDCFCSLHIRQYIVQLQQFHHLEKLKSILRHLQKNQVFLKDVEYINKCLYLFKQEDDILRKDLLEERFFTGYNPLFSASERFGYIKMLEAKVPSFSSCSKRLFGSQRNKKMSEGFHYQERILEKVAFKFYERLPFRDPDFTFVAKEYLGDQILSIQKEEEEEIEETEEFSVNKKKKKKKKKQKKKKKKKISNKVGGGRRRNNNNNNMVLVYFGEFDIVGNRCGIGIELNESGDVSSKSLKIIDEI